MTSFVSEATYADELLVLCKRLIKLSFDFDIFCQIFRHPTDLIAFIIEEREAHRIPISEIEVSLYFGNLAHIRKFEGL